MINLLYIYLLIKALEEKKEIRFDLKNIKF